MNYNDRNNYISFHHNKTALMGARWSIKKTVTPLEAPKAVCTDYESTTPRRFEYALWLV